MSGTGLALFYPTDFLVLRWPVLLRLCYGMSGTELAYAAPRLSRSSSKSRTRRPRRGACCAHVIAVLLSRYRNIIALLSRYYHVVATSLPRSPLCLVPFSTRASTEQRRRKYGG
eukprot:3133743-Rhodomonas_salina.1